MLHHGCAVGSNCSEQPHLGPPALYKLQLFLSYSFQSELMLRAAQKGLGCPVGWSNQCCPCPGYRTKRLISVTVLTAHSTVIVSGPADSTQGTGQELRPPVVPGQQSVSQESRRQLWGQVSTDCSGWVCFRGAPAFGQGSGRRWVALGPCCCQAELCLPLSSWDASLLRIPPCPALRKT